MTYILDGEVCVCPVHLRIGRQGKRLDNAHAGGIFVGVDDSGCLRETAYTEQGERFSKHPDKGVRFAGYKIEQMPMLIDCCKRMSKITPQRGLILWNVT